MFLHCNLKALEPNGPVGYDLGILESATLAAVICDESRSLTRAVTQTAPCTWPSTTITTTTLASEKVTPTAAATTRRYEICVKFGPSVVVDLRLTCNTIILYESAQIRMRPGHV
jgi:hypothetical protein